MPIFEDESYDTDSSSTHHKKTHTNRISAIPEDESNGAKPALKKNSLTSFYAPLNRWQHFNYYLLPHTPTLLLILAPYCGVDLSPYEDSHYIMSFG